MKKLIVPLITVLTAVLFTACNKSKDQAQNTPQVEGQIVIVAELSGDGKRDKGFKAAEDALQRVPDIKGIFAINDPSGLGAVGALEKAGKLDQSPSLHLTVCLPGKRQSRKEKSMLIQFSTRTKSVVNASRQL